jgi:hypothetical protein
MAVCDVETATSDAGLSIEVDAFDTERCPDGHMSAEFTGYETVDVMEVDWANVATVDHLVPKYWFGDDVHSNVKTACFYCNTLKGAYPDNDNVRLACWAISNLDNLEIQWSPALESAANLWVSLAGRVNFFGRPSLRRWHTSASAWSPPLPPKTPLRDRVEFGPLKPPASLREMHEPSWRQHSR